MDLDRRWSFVLSIAGAVSIRVKIMGIILGLILLFGLGTTMQMRDTLNRELISQLEKRGVSITRDLAARSTDLILTNSTYTLYELVRDTLENNEDVRYAYIVGPSGEVLVHTFGSRFPQDLRDVSMLAQGQEHAIEIIDTEEGLIRDVAVPIFEGRAGTAHVGMSELRLQQAVSAMTQRLLLTTALVSLFGLLIAYVLTTVLVRPISQLVELTKAVSRGDLEQRLSFKARDELGQLGDAFNVMTDDLARLSREREQYNLKLMERNRNLSALWEELRQKEEMRVQLLGKVISAQEEERKRIARELHDETSQSLTSVIVGLKLLEGARSPVEITEKAAELRSLTAKALEEVHHLALELRPSALDDAGLIPALQRYVKDYAAKHNITVDFQYSLDENLRLVASIETALYRIVQEALTNIAKHSMASYASILLDSREGNLLVIVEDNGIGFDARAMRSATAGEKSLGLFGMQERASLIGAHLTIESQPGSGTTIYAELPLPLIEVA